MQALLNQYVAETYLRNPAAMTSVSDFAGGFRTWIQAAGHSPPSRSEIMAALLEAGFIVGEYRDRAQILGIEIPRQRFRLEDGRITKTKGS